MPRTRQAWWRLASWWRLGGSLCGAATNCGCQRSKCDCPTHRAAAWARLQPADGRARVSGSAAGVGNGQLVVGTDAVDPGLYLGRVDQTPRRDRSARTRHAFSFPGKATLPLGLRFRVDGGGAVVRARGSAHALQYSPDRAPLPARRPDARLVLASPYRRAADTISRPGLESLVASAVRLSVGIPSDHPPCACSGGTRIDSASRFNRRKLRTLNGNMPT